MDLLTPIVTIGVAVLSSLLLEIGYGIAAILTSSEGGGVRSTMLSYSLPLGPVHGRVRGSSLSLPLAW